MSSNQTQDNNSVEVVGHLVAAAVMSLTFAVAASIAVYALVAGSPIVAGATAGGGLSLAIGLAWLDMREMERSSFHRAFAAPSDTTPVVAPSMEADCPGPEELDEFSRESHDRGIHSYTFAAHGGQMVRVERFANGAVCDMLVTLLTAVERGENGAPGASTTSRSQTVSLFMPNELFADDDELELFFALDTFVDEGTAVDAEWDIGLDGVITYAGFRSFDARVEVGSPS